MSKKDDLRKQRANTVINNISKKQEKQLAKAITRVVDALKQKFPGIELEYEAQWLLQDVVDSLREHFPEVEFHYYHSSSSMRPDGGILSLRDKKGELRPILIAEKKNQGTNDLRELEGKPKQAKGNAIERLGKNVIGFRTALLHEAIFPFVCFGDGCDFADDSSIIDRVVTIAMFGKLNKIYLHVEDGKFNRGSFFFKVEQWDEEEMFKISLEIAINSVFYYFSKYGEDSFEIHLFPEILQFALNNGYNIVLAEKQNWYPDLTFVNKERPEVMFAVDLKTTFRRNDTTAGFTLGSHGAYFKERDKDKNIQFPYSKYTGHFCLGVIYTRVDMAEFPDTDIYHVHELDEDDSEKVEAIGARKVTDVESLKSITSVIRDFDFFAVEKWKIASDSQGSGNTANIGSINDIDDLKNGRGAFSQLGEEWFDEYWMNYGHVSMMKDGKSVKVTNIWDFLVFKGREDLFERVVAKGAKRRKK